MEHFVTDWQEIETGSVLRYVVVQIDGEEVELPNSGNNAFVELPDNSRVAGVIRHVEGERWEFATHQGAIWSLVISGQPILDGRMRAREFTVLEVVGEN
jgi:hypothetical protein